MQEVGILIIDAKAESQRALHHLLDAEGWNVHVVSEPRKALTELSSGVWNLAVVNAELADPRGPLFAILRDLAHAEGVTVAAETDSDRFLSSGQRTQAVATVRKKRLRVLFLVPQTLAARFLPHLEREELPYAIQPYHLHEFVEKVSDLLLEAGAILRPIVGSRLKGAGSHRAAQNAKKDDRVTSMFASRQDYQMTEEEIAEFERQEEEERRKRQNKDKDREEW